MKQKRVQMVFAAAALLIGAAVVVGQTVVSAPQLPSPGDGRVWVNVGNKLVYASLGPGLAIVQDPSSPGEYVIEATAAAAPSWRTEQRVVADTETPLTLTQSPVSGSLTVARNGLLQWQGDDYAVDGQAVTLAFAQAGDRIILRYQIAGVVP